MVQRFPFFLIILSCRAIGMGFKVLRTPVRQKEINFLERKSREQEFSPLKSRGSLISRNDSHFSDQSARLALLSDTTSSSWTYNMVKQKSADLDELRCVLSISLKRGQCAELHPPCPDTPSNLVAQGRATMKTL